MGRARWWCALALCAVCMLGSAQAAALGRRAGAFMSSASTMSISAGSNRAGNDEALREDNEALMLGEPSMRLVEGEDDVQELGSDSLLGESTTQTIRALQNKLS